MPISHNENAPVYAEFCDGCQQELFFEKGTEVSATVGFSFGYFSKRHGEKGTFVFFHKPYAAVAGSRQGFMISAGALPIQLPAFH